MANALSVASAFGPHQVGDLITDQVEIGQILNSSYRQYVIAVSLDTTPPVAQGDASTLIYQGYFLRVGGVSHLFSEQELKELLTPALTGGYILPSPSIAPLIALGVI